MLTALAAVAAPAGPDDERSHEQRVADALVTLARGALDGGALPVTGGQRPHLTVVVDLPTLQHQPRPAPAPATGAAVPAAPAGGPAVLDRLGAVCDDTARLLACDAEVARVITGPDSQPLDVGRAKRTVTGAQRRALAVRDQGCVGCGAPSGWCQAHHLRPWADGGATDLGNLILVCHACHRSIHHHQRQPTRTPTGRWTLTRPPPRE